LGNDNSSHSAIVCECKFMTIATVGFPPFVFYTRAYYAILPRYVFGCCWVNFWSTTRYGYSLAPPTTHRHACRSTNRHVHTSKKWRESSYNRKILDTRKHNWPTKDSAEQWCIETFGRRQASLYLGDRHFILGRRAEERQTPRHRAEDVWRSDARARHSVTLAQTGYHTITHTHTHTRYSPKQVRRQKRKRPFWMYLGWRRNYWWNVGQISCVSVLICGRLSIACLLHLFIRLFWRVVVHTTVWRQLNMYKKELQTYECKKTWHNMTMASYTVSQKRVPTYLSLWVCQTWTNFNDNRNAQE